MEFIKVKNNEDILKIGLKDENDKPILDEKGEVVFWEFNLGDLEIPLKWSKIVETHKKNRNWLKSQFVIIEKKEDVKGKNLLSKKEEEKIKIVNDYYKKEIENYNTFLGENGVEKFLNGNKPYWEMFEHIDEAIEQILPKFEVVIGNIDNKIKEKYSNKESNVLE